MPDTGPNQNNNPSVPALFLTGILLNVNNWQKRTCFIKTCMLDKHSNEAKSWETGIPLCNPTEAAEQVKFFYFPVCTLEMTARLPAQPATFH